MRESLRVCIDKVSYETSLYEKVFHETFFTKRFSTEPSTPIDKKRFFTKPLVRNFFLLLPKNGSVRNSRDTKPLKVLPVYPSEDPF